MNVLSVCAGELRTCAGTASRHELPATPRRAENIHLMTMLTTRFCRR
ncbi:TPA: hypothetical protein PBP77_004854 [Escherichia coli]|nr:hypothetical protein [Escherichia coli]